MKPWYKSKTLLFNLLTCFVLVIAYLTTNAAIFGAAKDQVLFGLGLVAVVVNFWLRTVTDTGIGGNDS